MAVPLSIPEPLTKHAQWLCDGCCTVREPRGRASESCSLLRASCASSVPFNTACYSSLCCVTLGQSLEHLFLFCISPTFFPLSLLPLLLRLPRPLLLFPSSSLLQAADLPRGTVRALRPDKPEEPPSSSSTSSSSGSVSASSGVQGKSQGYVGGGGGGVGALDRTAGGAENAVSSSSSSGSNNSNSSSNAVSYVQLPYAQPATQGTLKPKSHKKGAGKEADKARSVQEGGHRSQLLTAEGKVDMRTTVGRNSLAAAASSSSSSSSFFPSSSSFVPQPSIASQRQRRQEMAGSTQTTVFSCTRSTPCRVTHCMSPSPAPLTCMMSV